MSAQDTTSLTGLIRMTADSGNLDDPREIAEKVAANTPADVLREFYATSLVGTVREVLRVTRNRAMDEALSPAPRSAKLSQRRDWWSEMLASRVHVAGTWKTLGVCGKQDLASAASERRQDAERELARADQYDELRSLLSRFKKKTVADLPADAVRTAFGRDAA